jgi:hypothetical protein
MKVVIKKQIILLRNATFKFDTLNIILGTFTNIIIISDYKSS